MEGDERARGPHGLVAVEEVVRLVGGGGDALAPRLEVTLRVALLVAWNTHEMVAELLRAEREQLTMQDVVGRHFLTSARAALRLNVRCHESAPARRAADAGARRRGAAVVGERRELDQLGAGDQAGAAHAAPGEAGGATGADPVALR